MTKQEIKDTIISWSCCGDHARATSELLEVFEELINTEIITYNIEKEEKKLDDPNYFHTPKTGCEGFIND